jgi:exopolysaccharide production protein ExoY
MTHFEFTTGARPAPQYLTSESKYQRGGKRCFDFVLALILLPIVAPMIAILCAANSMTGSGSFFGHRRIGKNGKPFVCWKIRTMALHSDAILNRHLSTNPAAAAEWHKTQKLSDDPRVTRFGRFLRCTSLDELPQIWNVLKGDMSFVGPRPITREELHHYATAAQQYRSVRPGITGTWQIYGRTNGCYKERVKMDATYCHSQSIRRDIILIAMTALIIFKATGK